MKEEIEEHVKGMDEETEFEYMYEIRHYIPS